jgi:large subunit ribosomal protein L25
MSDLTLEAQPRQMTGRKVRQLRRQGLVPVVVYGQGQDPVNLQVTARALDATLHHGGFSQLVRVKVAGGGNHNILIREVQRHPVHHGFLHADFYAVNMNEKQEVSVPVVGTGKPEALASGLMVLQALDMVDISALPNDIPASIEVDISELSVDRPITIADLPTLSGVEYLSDPAEHVFTMLTTYTGEEAEEEAGEEELVEPEVVSRHRDEEEED